MSSTRLASACSLAAAAVLSLILLVSLKTGVSQQHFESIWPAPQYAKELAEQAGPLRLILSLDALFIALYASSGLLLTRALGSAHNRLLMRLCAGAVLLAGALDLLENHHITSLLRATELGLPLSQAAISAQSVASMFKWHLGYVAFFALGLALEPRNVAERALRGALLLVQLPVGAAVYTAQGPAELLCFWLRYLNLLVGFIAFAWLLHRRDSPGRAFGESGSVSPA